MSDTRPVSVDWSAVKASFERLLDCPPAARRAALAADPVDDAVRREVAELLAQHEAEERAGGQFLAVPTLLPAHTPVDRSGERLGPWRITALLGSGGMGEVWEAQRDDGAYDARVAVKVLRMGSESTRLLQHFAREQRLLARLNHPHIARLLDAGRTGDDRPYFVLEAVEGRPIDHACRALPLPQRLALFLQLADAVEHAHRHHLVHRDLKPANVLVTADGQVKLLDFGIAQALDALPEGLDGAEASRPLTPAFASPEQVRGGPITVATDVYSLGVILYLLLTGSRPYARDARDSRDALRAVLDEAPLPASRAPRGAQGDPGIDRRRLAGDLDAIVAQALSKEPAARQASVAALAADLRAYLADKPVVARRGGPGYVAGKFMRRHRAAVLAGLLALLVVLAGLGLGAWHTADAIAVLALAGLVGGFGVSLWQARLAREARDEARSRLAATSGLVRDIVMRYADTVTYLPGGLKMKADLLKDTIAYLERLSSGAGGDAALAGELAKAYARLSDLQLEGLDATLNQPDEAERHGELALALFAQGEPAHRDDAMFYTWWTRALRARAKSQRRRGDAQAALQTMERARSLLQAALPRFAHDTTLRGEFGSVLLGIGQAHDTWIEAHLNQPERALEALAASEAVYLELKAQTPSDSTVHYQLGTVAGAQMIVLSRQGRIDEALAKGRLAVACREAALELEPDHVAYRQGAAGEANNLTRVLLDAGRVDEALAVSQRGEQLICALEAQDPSLSTWTDTRRLFALHRGRALLAAGQADEALPRLSEALLGMAAATQPASVRRRGWCQLERARALHALQRDDEARAAIEASLADLRAVMAADPADADAKSLHDQAAACAATLTVDGDPAGPALPRPPAPESRTISP